MKLNPTLTHDIDVIVTNDCEKYMTPFAKAMTQAQREHFLDDIVNELKQTFQTYGVEYTEETVKAAMVALIWSTSATDAMFTNGNNPVARENNHPHGIAIHGGLAAISALNHAIKNYQD